MSDQTNSNSLNEAIYTAKGYSKNRYLGDVLWCKECSDPISNEYLFFPPDYSNDLNEAWKLVTEMENEGYCVTIKTPFLDGDPYKVKVDKKGIDGYTFECGETVTVSICKAWLF